MATRLHAAHRLNNRITMPATTPRPTRVALVEDETDIRESIEEYLTLAGFAVWGVNSAEAFYRRFAAGPVDVVVLDLGLPGEDGLAVARLLEANPAVAVVILSARGTLDDRLQGLRAGADRYLVKPVNLEELAENIRAVMKRGAVGAGAANTLSPAAAQLDDHVCWTLDLTNWQLRAPDQRTMRLTAHEFALIQRLIASQGEAVPKRLLADEIFGPYIANAGDRLNVLVTCLRKKAATHFGTPLPLKTLHQLGYAFNARSRMSG